MKMIKLTMIMNTQSTEARLTQMLVGRSKADEKPKTVEQIGYLSAEWLRTSIYFGENLEDKCTSIGLADGSCMKVRESLKTLFQELFGTPYYDDWEQVEGFLKFTGASEKAGTIRINREKIVGVMIDREGDSQLIVKVGDETKEFSVKDRIEDVVAMLK